MAPKTTPQPYTRARQAYSSLQRERLHADHKAYFPAVLEGIPKLVKKQAIPADEKDAAAIKGLFPQTYDTPLVEFAQGSASDGARPPVKVGVVLSGGQAPGGHNVIAGIFDGIKQWNADSTMIGFLDGPHGIFTGNFCEITDEIMDGFRNTGGFDMLGSGRHKIESKEQFEDSMAVCNAIGLDGLVVIGGDDSNTNGAVLAEFFKANGCKTKVVGAPKTIDGDLKCPPYIPVSFGFDTACKTYATLVGNVAIDALSAQKYYHIVRLMGRSASNIALEVALLTRPNVCLLGEEVAREKKSLKQITVELADMINERCKLGKDYGVIILPEGLIEFIPEFNTLMSELNDKLAEPGVEPTEAGILKVLSPANAEVFKFLPDFIRAQLLLDRDPHGNVQVAKIETEKLLAATISAELKERKKAGNYSGSFKTQFHSYGYEGRAGMPTIFDGAYCYALGCTASALLCNGCTGLIASVKNLLAPAREWECGGVPVTSLCVIERRKGKEKPVIKKALVEMDGPMSQPYTAYVKMRETLKFTDAYNVTGPIQYDMENCEASKDIPLTLQLELGRAVQLLPTIPAPKKMGNFLFIGQPKESRSALQQWRAGRAHQMPECFALQDLSSVRINEVSVTMCRETDMDYLRKVFSNIEAPLVQFECAADRPCKKQRTDNNLKQGAVVVPKNQRIGVVFSGRQAPGCHDFLCGMVSMFKNSPDCKVLGIVGGTHGLFEKQYVELTPELCQAYAGTGGLELIGRTVDRLKSDEELDKAMQACKDLQLTGLVLVGGARTNSDAAYVAEYFAKANCGTAVVGAPCGIEGNMVNEFVEASIGFDSAAKAIAQLVGNTAIDGSSARKYYYFLRIMDGASTGGRTSTSHLALEVALQTKPNMLLLTEEVDEKRMSLRELINEVANMIAARAENGRNFGTVLVAEGLLSAIPEFRNLISELEAIPMPCDTEKMLGKLTQWSRALFQSLPDFIQQELMLERQSNAALQMSQLETERLLAALVEDELKHRKEKGTFKGSFSPVCQFIGYQARCSVPSDFDMDYAFTLGATSAILAANGRNGYMALVNDLSAPVQEWRVGGVPFTAMLNVPASDSMGSFRPRPVIFPHRVDLDGGAFKKWEKERSQCAQSEMYENPGPIQLSGPSSSYVSSTITMKFSYLRELEELRSHFQQIENRCRPGCDPRTVRVAKQSLATLNLIMDELAGPTDTVEQREGFSMRARGTTLA